MTHLTVLKLIFALFCSGIEEVNVKNEASVNELFGLLYGGKDQDYIGEKVSQLEHALQAAELADKETDGDTVAIIAALFHDIGHLLPWETIGMEGCGVVDHASKGADFLKEKGFCDKVCRLVELHTVAKRYLAYSDPGFVSRLSPASTITLKHQGGPMSEQEVKEFEKDPSLKLAVKLRSWDDRAKDSTRKAPGLEKYKTMVKNHLNGEAAESLGWLFK